MQRIKPAVGVATRRQGLVTLLMWCEPKEKVLFSSLISGTESELSIEAIIDTETTFWAIIDTGNKGCDGPLDRQAYKIRYPRKEKGIAIPIINTKRRRNINAKYKFKSAFNTKAKVLQKAPIKSVTDAPVWQSLTEESVAPTFGLTAPDRQSPLVADAYRTPSCRRRY
ncbi:hypothetical protein EVAR_84554_1 [Eumeta japonica]|uniref:Uncharacterized protein n=1 Tax=Eumeta variegata TaxID=151549 RepID=A0A4C1UJD3_EUMVA|nr:hypothetical protein EVAR_84554_1 [Eumeta japonica]